LIRSRSNGIDCSDEWGDQPSTGASPQPPTPVIHVLSSGVGISKIRRCVAMRRSDAQTTAGTAKGWSPASRASNHGRTVLWCGWSSRWAARKATTATAPVEIEFRTTDTDEIEFVDDLDVLVESSKCSCNAGDDNPY